MVIYGWVESWAKFVSCGVVILLVVGGGAYQKRIGGKATLGV
jgi:hypothetical protein